MRHISNPVEGRRRMISQEARRNQPEPWDPDEIYGTGEGIEYADQNYVVPL